MGFYKKNKGEIDIVLFCFSIGMLIGGIYVASKGGDITWIVAAVAGLWAFQLSAPGRD